MALKSSLTYALVAPCIPLMGHGHEAYTYHCESVADSLVAGSVVRISFGKRKILGVVLHVGVKRPRYPTKPVAKIFDAVLTSQQIQFAELLSASCHGGLGFTLRLFIPHSV